MIPRNTVFKLVLPPVIMAVAIIGVIVFLNISATLRNNTVYADRITTAYPAMRDTFTVTGTTVKNDKWVIVEIKNTVNNDTLRALFYDPHGPAGNIQLVAAPSTRESFDSLMTVANIKSEDEATDAAK